MPRRRQSTGRMPGISPSIPKAPKLSVTPPRVQVKPPTSVFEGLPKGSIGKHLGQFNRTLDALKKATGGRF